MTDITTQDWNDYCYMRQLEERGEQDIRFEIEKNPEPDDPSNLYFVRVFDWRTGKELESYTTDDPYAGVEAAREAQEYTLEQRFDMYAERGW